MRADVTKKLFTVDEYYRMADAGILTEGERVELIEGEIGQLKDSQKKTDEQLRLLAQSVNRLSDMQERTEAR